MPRFIASYDLKSTSPDPHSEFLRQAGKFGWRTWLWIASANRWFRLPNTTLIGEFPTRAQADKAFDDSVAATTAALPGRVIVEKYFLATYVAALVDSDVKRPPAAR